MKPLASSVAVLASFTLTTHAVPVAWNGHYYDYFPASGIAWPDADSAARALTHNGLSGHLATLTSAEENRFVSTLVDGLESYPGDPKLEDVLAAWVGGYQDPADEPDPTKGWKWVNGEGAIPMVNGNSPFGNWFTGEPNDWLGPQSENHLSIWGSAGYGNTIGTWNDEGGPWNISGYLVEYETAGKLPDVESPAPLLLLALSGLSLTMRRARSAA
ncbi:MAG: hypothetical protein IT580_15310 [Verrucomicrobiales bacterium]|nr:hypothetical protein [Verrucomicrobiales bacterium]